MYKRQDPDCPIRSAILAPIVADERVVAALAAYGPSTSTGLVRATEELAAWVSTQIELAELGRHRTRLMEAELRALRAQISPHFIYNCLAAIASFVRTDPDRALELLLEVADFTRDACRRGGAYTTLRDKLANIERYLSLGKARFGDRLSVKTVSYTHLVRDATPRQMTRLRHRDPRRVEAGGLHDESFQGPRHHPVAPHERAQLTNLGVHDRGHQHDGHPTGEPDQPGHTGQARGQLSGRGRRPEIDEFAAGLRPLPGPADLLGRQQTRGRGRMQAGQGLHRSPEHEGAQRLGLGAGLYVTCLLYSSRCV